MAKRKSSFDFEGSLGELEQIVGTMEQGDLTLEASLQQFENGIKLARACQKALTEAEQKVQVLLEKNGEEQLETFDDGE